MVTCRESDSHQPADLADLERPLVPDESRAEPNEAPDAAPDEARAERYRLPRSDSQNFGPCDLGLGIIVLVAVAFIGSSMFRRNFSVLASAAWSFILFFPLLQVLFRRVDDEEAEEEVKYKLSGNVVKKKAPEDLKCTDINLFEKKQTEWYEKNRDGRWYRGGLFPLLFTILKAMLNIYSVMRTAIQYISLKEDHNNPGWLGITWVVSIEIPYMFLFLLPYFVCTAMQLRGWCTSLDREEKIKAVVRLAGLLKSLGRFSALNLLEFIRIEDLIHQKGRMQKVMSGIGAVIGFMAFRGKVSDIAFVFSHHTFAWTLGQWLRVFALINSMVSITDVRNKMIFASIQAKDYRKDRWLEAVGDHLWSEAECGLFRVFQRLVSLGPDDVIRLIEDLGIDYKEAQSSSKPTPKIPRLTLDDCWNWQLTNVVGVVRFGLFYVRARANNETASHQAPGRLQQGKVKEQHKAQKKVLEQERTMASLLQNAELAAMYQAGEFWDMIHELNVNHDAKVSNLKSQLKATERLLQEEVDRQRESDKEEVIEYFRLIARQEYPLRS